MVQSSELFSDREKEPAAGSSFGFRQSANFTPELHLGTEQSQ